MVIHRPCGSAGQNVKADQETMVRYETDEKVGIITLDRASKLNAINAVMKDQIIAAFVRADKDAATSVVVLRAEGRSFSAGFDIGATPDRGCTRITSTSM
jgi:enoyl-CoA hydratase/carnithine racemase